MGRPGPVNATALLRPMSSLGGAAAGYRQRRIDIREQIKQAAKISSFLAKSYVDRAREDFGDVSIQT